MPKPEITAEELRAALTYEPGTGIFRWTKNGKIAGHVRSDGYTDIRFKDCLFRAHRLAWLWMTGSWPTMPWIDHIDRDPGNNRWGNLREVTLSQNHQNQKVRKDSRVGLRGVEAHKSGLWRARLVIQGKRIHVGYFKTPQEAFAARIEAERKYFTHSAVLHTQSAYPDAYVLPGAIESESL